MVGAPRTLPQHGAGTVIVRGHVEEVMQAKPATGFFKWFKNDVPAMVRLKIDGEQYVQLQAFLAKRTEGSVARTFTVGWGVQEPLPNRGDRAWITFGYAGPRLDFFEGTPPISYKGLEVIQNEDDVREGELVASKEALLPAL